MSRENRILVTGGAGFVGSHVVENLIKHNFLVTVLDNFSTGSINNLPSNSGALRIIEGSILNQNDINESMIECQCVIHLAAIASVGSSISKPIESHAVNFEGTLNILEGMRRNNISRIIYASSAAVYGDNSQLPLSEDYRPMPLSPYGIDKLTSEYYLKYYADNFNYQTISCRFFNVYGPRQNPLSDYSGVISLLMKSVVSKEIFKIYGDGNQTRDFIYVKDLSKIIVSLIKSDNQISGVLNLGSGEAISINELCKIITTLALRNLNIEYLNERDGDIRDSVADISRLKRIIPEFKGTPLVDGIKELLMHTQASI